MQDHKTKYKIQTINATKYKLTTPLLFPMGIYKKSTAQSSNNPDGCNADQGSLILATSHTHKQKIDCEHDPTPPITHTRP